MGPVGDLALRILDRKRPQRTDTCSKSSKEENLLASMLKGNMQTLPLNSSFLLLVTAELFCPSTLHGPFGCELTSGGASTSASCIEGAESGKSDWESTAWPCSHSWLLLRVDELLPR